VNMVDDNGYAPVNWAEIGFAIIHPIRTKAGYDFSRQAIAKTLEIYGETTDGQISNAFQHAYWNALMVFDMGEDLAEKIGNNHEWALWGKKRNVWQPYIFDDITIQLTGQDAIDMDLFNNQQGRDAAVYLKNFLSDPANKDKTSFLFHGIRISVRRDDNPAMLADMIKALAVMGRLHTARSWAREIAGV